MKAIVLLSSIIMLASCAAPHQSDAPPIVSRPTKSEVKLLQPPPERLAAHGSVKPYRVGGEVKAPILLESVGPDITPCERPRTLGLTVTEVVVDEYGHVRDPKIIKEVTPCESKAMLDAVRKWKFRPGTYKGKPVPVVFYLSVPIDLN